MACFGGNGVKLYLLHFLIGKLQLTSEKIYEIGERSLQVKLKFLDFPVFEVSTGDFNFAKPVARDDNNVFDFSSGHVCLFAKEPQGLVSMMRNGCLKIAIFCMGDSYPVAETQIPLYGCLCDQIAMAANDSEHLPKPYTLKGCYNLLDPGKNLSGSLNIEFYLTCMGQSLSTHYALQAKSFLFRNEHAEGEYVVQRMGVEGNKDVGPDGEDEEVILYQKKSADDGQEDVEKGGKKKKEKEKKKKGKGKKK